MSGSFPPDRRQEQQYLAIKTAAGGQKLQIVSMRGMERVSEVYRYHLELYTNDPSLNWQSLIGSEATVTINGTGMSAGTRHVHGVLSELSYVGTSPATERRYYRATLVPHLALLDLSQDCRIFQKKSTLDIVKDVLSRGGVTNIDTRLTATYPAREFCVQWRETDLNFVLRLMEDEGMFFWFEHADGVEKIVIADDADAHKPCPIVPSVEWSGITGMPFEDQRVHDCSLSLRMVPDAVGVDAWNFETPTTSLYAKKQGSSAKRTINDWVGTHQDRGTGERLAGIRLDAYAVDAKVLQISGNNRYFCCGHRFALTKHPDAALNGSWVVLEHTLEATPESFAFTLRACPAASVFRAPQRAQRPSIPSTQTAVVVGPSGEDVSTDNYGRVKIQFHWDRLGKGDEDSSCWVRVAQGWAGGGWGSMFVPRIGSEVVISFLDGDPDRPLVTGSVYNAQKTVPLALPGAKTQSVIRTRTSPNAAGKYNELRFEDKDGTELVHIRAQKDLMVDVLNDSTTTVIKDMTLTVDGKQVVKVKQDSTFEVLEGNETHSVAKGTRKITVKGDESHANSGKFTHSVEGDYNLTVKGAMSLSVGGSLTLKAQQLTIETTGGAITIKSASGIQMTAATGISVEAGAALTAKGATAKLEGVTQVDVIGATANVKAQAMGEVSAGGILTVKGALVRIN
jgi:type VI secretion system secreted protein VgrG